MLPEVEEAVKLLIADEFDQAMVLLKELAEQIPDVIADCEHVGDDIKLIKAWVPSKVAAVAAIAKARIFHKR